MHDWYLFDVGWLFFAAWSVAVAVVTVAAFGRDLFALKTPDAGPATLPDKGRTPGRI
jgi:hypothetical protein